MRGMALGLGLSRRGGTFDPSAGYALYLPFSAASPTYRVGASTYSPVTALPGYAYTRSGAKGEVNALTSGDVIDDFAANVPAIIPGVGYWSRGALTNLMLQSQTFDNASWSFLGTRTANTAVAPDGTTTADTLAFSAVNDFCRQDFAFADASVGTGSVWVKASASGAATYIRLTSNNAAAWNTGGSTKIALTSSWQRIMLIGSVTAGSGTRRVGLAALDAAGTLDPDCYGNVDVWQGQFITGNHPAGGPIIVTGASTVAIGADSFAFTFPNGTYSVDYTFQDDTTDNVPAMVIGAGVFTIPTTYSKAIKLVTIV